MAMMLAGLPMQYAATSSNPARSAGNIIRAQAFAYPQKTTIIGQLAAPQLPWIKTI